MLALGVRADRFVVGEPTDNSASTLHAGSLEAELTVHGRTRHLSKREDGVDAIAKMLKLIPTLTAMSFTGPERPDYRGLQRVGIGVIRGGLGPDYQDWRPSLLADRCAIKSSVRYSPWQTADPDLVADARLNQGGQRLLTGPFEVGREADIVQTVVRAHRPVVREEPKIGAVAPYKFYGTDAVHLARAGMGGLVYGPGGKYNTMPDERVELRDLFNAARVYARVIVETCA